MQIDQYTNIFDHLRDRIIGGEFEPTQRLRSEVLRNDYDASASHIREQLFRLSAVGLVDFVEQRGFRMPEQSVEILHDVTKTRIMLEREGACLSIRYGGVGWEARLTAAHHELKHIEKHIESNLTKIKNSSEGFDDVLILWANAEMNFHRTLIDECRSEILKEFHLQIYHRFRQQLITADKNFDNIPMNVDQHQSILEAVLKRDEDLVKERLHDHLSRHLIDEMKFEKAISLTG